MIFFNQFFEKFGLAASCIRTLLHLKLFFFMYLKAFNVDICLVFPPYFMNILKLIFLKISNVFFNNNNSVFNLLYFIKFN